MTPASLIRLFAMATIGGASFLLMRIGAPVLGPVMLAEYRVAVAALFLLIVGVSMRRRLELAQHWKHFLIIGMFNSALPFLLFAFAAQTLSTSLLSILNASSPIWATLIAAARSRQRLSSRRVLGLFLGVAGVALLVGFDQAALQPGAGIAIAAVLAGAFSYGVASTYTKSAKQIDAFSNAHGSMWVAAILIAPAVPFSGAHAPLTMDLMLIVLALGIVCSGIAYLLYFQLIADLGAASALTVTFLVPMFGILWGSLFLGEPIGWQTVLGSGIVITGTALVTGFSPAGMFWNNKSAKESPTAG